MRRWKYVAAAFTVGAVLAMGTAGAAWADHGQGDHGTDIRGVVTAVSFTPPASSQGSAGTGSTGSGSSTSSSSDTSGASSTNASSPAGGAVHRASVRRDDRGSVLSGVPVGTLTVLSPVEGSVSVTILSTTRFEVTGAAMAEGLVGAAVQVSAVAVPGSASASGSGSGSGASTTSTTLEALKVQTENGDQGESQEIKGTVTAIDPTAGTISIQTNDGNVITALLDSGVTVTLGDQTPGTLADVTVGARIKAVWQVTGGQIDITAIRVLDGGDQGNGNQGDG